MVSDVLMEWEQQTLAGDEHFHRKEFLIACQCFERAVQAMLPWLEAPLRMESTGVRCFALACCNTAYAAVRAGHFHLAEHYYRYCLSQLENLIGKPECHRVRDILLLESEQAYRRYCRFLLERTDKTVAKASSSKLLRSIARLTRGHQNHSPARRASLLLY